MDVIAVDGENAFVATDSHPPRDVKLLVRLRKVGKARRRRVEHGRLADSLEDGCWIVWSATGLCKGCVGGRLTAGIASAAVVCAETVLDGPLAAD